jgi:hypothetical protein
MTNKESKGWSRSSLSLLAVAGPTVLTDRSKRLIYEGLKPDCWANSFWDIPLKTLALTKAFVFVRIFRMEKSRSLLFPVFPLFYHVFSHMETLLFTFVLLDKNVEITDLYCYYINVNYCLL